MRNCDGVVFCVDSQVSKTPENLESWKNLKDNLALQKDNLEEMPHVLQYNKRDMPNVSPEQYLDYILNNGEKRTPAFLATAVSGEGVIETLNAVAKLVLQDFIEKH